MSYELTLTSPISPITYPYFCQLAQSWGLRKTL
jgi:hypothetical protein